MIKEIMVSNKKFFLILIILLVLILSPVLVLSAISLPNPLKAKTFQELINNIIDILFYLAVAFLPLMIVIAAFFFMTAAENPENITTGKKIILWSFIGFLVITAAKGFVALIEKTFQKP